LFIRAQAARRFGYGERDVTRRLLAMAGAVTVALVMLALPASAQTPADRPQAVSPMTGVAAAGAATVVSPGKPRPKIGLVLSGGGARGLTHIGVLKVLQQMRVPIDYIAATSMGAIVGGLYASGMSPDAMEQRLAGVSWPTLLSDSPPRLDMGFRRKEEETAFPLSLELGYRDGEFRAFKGALSGSNLELFLHELTRNVDAISSFDRLPIPYRAVATNMVTGKELIFDRGPLYKAMRASMSVPGMFAPVEVDGTILGDGGLVNNLPVDVVRAMGADIVIAVNIGTPLMSRDQLSSIVGYASQMLNILTEQNVRAQLGSLRPQDILISPDLGDLTFIDFTAGSKFVALGKAAAQDEEARLAMLAASPTEYAAIQERLAIVAAEPTTKLDFVNVEGTLYANPQVLEDQMETQPGKAFDLKVLEKDLARIYGRGDFEQIDYQLLTVGGKNGLIVNVAEKSWGPNFLRFGLSLDSDFQGDARFNILFGHKRAWINSLGGQWTNEVVLGSLRRYFTEFYQPLSTKTPFFTSAYGVIQRAPEYIFDGNSRVAEYNVLTEVAGVDVGTPLGTLGEVRLGYRWTHVRGDPTVASKEFPIVAATEQGLRLLGRWDSLDNPYFPRKGLRAEAEVFVGQRDELVRGGAFPTPVEDDGLSSRAAITGNGAWEFSRDRFLNVYMRAGGITKERDDLITDFNLGGFLQLSGLRTNQLSGNYVGFVRGVYYHQIANIPVIGRAVYAGASVEAGNVWTTSSDISASGLRTAGSIFVAADTWLGPFYVAYGRASGGQSSFYLFLGRP
jgi:NTE family protein